MRVPPVEASPSPQTVGALAAYPRDPMPGALPRDYQPPVPTAGTIWDDGETIWDDGNTLWDKGI